MLLQRNRGRSDRDAAEGDCPVRSSAETKAAVPRVSVFSRFPPPCLGVRSFPAFIARIGLPSFPVSAAVPRGPVFSRFHRPHRVAVFPGSRRCASGSRLFPLSSPASGRTGSYRARCCEPPLSRARENRSSGNRIARSRGYFRTSLVCGGASLPLFRVRYAVSHIALLAKEGESPVTDPPPRSIVCAGRITPPAGSRES